MIDITKPVRTKVMKRPVEIIVFCEKLLQPIIGIMGDDEKVSCWTRKGRFCLNEDSCLDLENYEVAA